MRTGYESVKRGKTEDGKIEVTSTWKGGRTGIFREGKGYSGIAKGEKGKSEVGQFDGYEPLVADWSNFGTWTEAGARDASERATGIWKRRLADAPALPLDGDRVEALNAFVARRTAEGGVPPGD